MEFQCPRCKAVLASDDVTEGMAVTCPECNETFCVAVKRRKVKLRAVSGHEDSEDTTGEGLPGSIHSKMASTIGIEKLQGFKISDLFAEVFSKHSREEVEGYFTVGTAKSTPSILEVDASWPKPWIFMRMIIASLILYFLFLVGWKVFENQNLLPGLMMIGSFAIPISTLVLFLELNVRRNVSLYMVARLMLLGGIFSLLLSLLMFEVVGEHWLGDTLAGPVEEIGKVLAMVAVARAAKYKYKLNGLLVGAAVGVGFAAFESMGYAMHNFTNVAVDGTIGTLIENNSDNIEIAKYAGVHYGSDAMLNVIVVRGLLSPFGHIVWSAIAGCALWRVIKGQEFKLRMLFDEKFIRLLLVSVFLHMVWNSPLQLPFFGKYLLVGVVGWFVCLSLVQEGLHEIAAEQAEVRGQLESITESNSEDDAGGGV